jgi:hypothetical protein
VTTGLPRIATKGAPPRYSESRLTYKVPIIISGRQRSMESQSATRASMHRTDQWQSLAGEVVEVWLGGAVYRKGLVDDAMPDASGLWLVCEGPFPRQFIDAASGFEVWTSLYPRSARDGVT